MPIVLFSSPDGSKGLGSADVAIIGTGESVPRGIESLWQYNGLVINDLSTIDKYRLMSIDGIDDADIRDSREDNPDSTGEQTYNSNYGGRTIALKVRIEAYNLFKLRDMEEALKTAFMDLEEKPLYVLTGNPLLDHHIYVKKFSKLQSSDEQSRANVFFRDYLINVRASDPRFLRNKAKIFTIDLNAHAGPYEFEVVNGGNFNAYPEIRVYGNTAHVSLTNQSILDRNGNETTFAFKSSITVGSSDFRKITTKGRTVVNATGVNKYSDVQPGSTFLEIAPGSNTLSFEAGQNVAHDGNSLLEVRFREAWV